MVEILIRGEIVVGVFVSLQHCNLDTAQVSTQNNESVCTQIPNRSFSMLHRVKQAPSQQQKEITLERSQEKLNGREFH